MPPSGKVENFMIVPDHKNCVGDNAISGSLPLPS